MSSWLRKIHFSVMSSSKFSFKNYDCIGFDLDHTISLYQINNIINLQYQLLIDYLFANGFERDAFSPSLTKHDVDFIQRGLFLDFKRGNILKIASDGTIVSGTHGTKRMDKRDLISTYGRDCKWECTDKFVSDILSTWEPPVCDNMRSMMEFFDCQVPLIFGKSVDFIDTKSTKKSDDYSVWPIILDGIINMFETGGGFYEALYSKPEIYLRKCSDIINDWLKKLKENNKFLFLITGSREKEASFLAEYCLSKDWKNNFDIIIYDAKKPGFFSKDRPFLENEISLNKNNLELTQGNWNELYSIISKKLSIDKPRCVYIGDNLIQDIYATSLTSGIDAVSLIEELSEEEMLNEDKSPRHPFSEYIKSNFWGSYLISGDGKTFTVWGDIMRKYSKFNIPSLDYIADKPIDHEYVFKPL